MRLQSLVIMTSMGLAAQAVSSSPTSTTTPAAPTAPSDASAASNAEPAQGAAAQGVAVAGLKSAQIKCNINPQPATGAEPHFHYSITGPVSTGVDGALQFHEAFYEGATKCPRSDTGPAAQYIADLRLPPKSFFPNSGTAKRAAPVSSAPAAGPSSTAGSEADLSQTWAIIDLMDSGKNNEGLTCFQTLMKTLPTQLGMPAINCVMGAAGAAPVDDTTVPSSGTTPATGQTPASGSTETDSDTSTSPTPASGAAASESSGSAASDEDSSAAPSGTASDASDDASGSGTAASTAPSSTASGTASTDADAGASQDGGDASG